MPSTATDSSLFGNAFSSEPMRAVFPTRIASGNTLEFEAALATVQGRLGIIPADAAAEIAAHCGFDKIDMDELRRETERIGSPVLGLVHQLAAACKDGLGGIFATGARRRRMSPTRRDDTAGPRGLDLIKADLADLSNSLADLAQRYRDTPHGRAELLAARGADHVRLQDRRGVVGGRAASAAARRARSARFGRRASPARSGTLASLPPAVSTPRRR